MPGSPRLDMRSQLTRSSLESVASSFKSGLARWRQDARNQDCFYERQDDQDSDLAEESKLLECPPVERSWRAPHMLVYRASVVILLIIVAMLSYFLWTCANNLKDSVIGDLKIQVGNPPKLPIKDVTSEPRKALVIASWSSQNMSWLSELSDESVKPAEIHGSHNQAHANSSLVSGRSTVTSSMIPTHPRSSPCLEIKVVRQWLI